MTAHLDLRSRGALLGGPVAIVLLLALQELTEMVLEQEGGVEFPHSHLIIYNQTRHSTVSVINTGLFCEGEIDRLTSYRGDDLVQKFHTCAFPDLLYNGSQLLVGLLEVTCLEQSIKISMELIMDVKLK